MGMPDGNACLRRWIGMLDLCFISGYLITVFDSNVILICSIEILNENIIDRMLSLRPIREILGTNCGCGRGYFQRTCPRAHDESGSKISTSCVKKNFILHPYKSLYIFLKNEGKLLPLF